MQLKKTPCMLWKIYLYENFLFILHYKYPNNIPYIYKKFHETNGFVKLGAVSKLSTFFVYYFRKLSQYTTKIPMFGARDESKRV